MLLNHRTLFETIPVHLNKTEARSAVWPWATWCNFDLSKHMMLISGPFISYPFLSCTCTHTDTSSWRMLFSHGVRQASGRAVVELAWLINQCGHRHTGHSAKAADIEVQTSDRAGGIRILVFLSVGS